MYGDNAAYGSFGPKAFASKDKKHGINLFAIFVNFLVPCLIFLAVSASLSFKLHNEVPALAWIIVVLCLQLVVACGFVAWNRAQRTQAADSSESQSTIWYSFLFTMGLISWLTSTVLGMYNYSLNMAPFFDVNSLNSHNNVNPLTVEGQQLMDAGIITFDRRATLDLQRSISFRNNKVYCVAPVTMRNATAGISQFDFWAVGIDCCPGHRGSFKCGEYDNPFAHAGLRVIREDQSAFFRLAVQQAEAAFGLEAAHPIFVQWVSDPVAMNQTYMDTGMRWFLMGLYSACIIQAIMLAGVSLLHVRVT